MVKRTYARKPRLVRKRKIAKKRVYKSVRRLPMFTPKSHIPFGQSQKVKHRYLENYQLQTSVGAPAVYTFAVNSLYDPNYTGTGHQPMGFDQMAAIFQSYTVVGVNASIKVWNRDADEFIGFAIYFSEFATISIGIQGLLEQGALKYHVLPPAGINPAVRTLKAGISVKKFFKVNNIMDDDLCRGTTTSSPSRLLYMHVIMWQPDGGSTSAGGSFYLTLDQLAIWHRPNTMAQS